MKQTILILLTLYVCTARNAMGRFWYATNENQAIAEADAIRICQSHSLFGCYSTGCTPSTTPITKEKK